MKINVGILRGGIGPEYDTSIRSGGQAILHLNRDKYRPVDLHVDKSGVLFADGAPIEPNALKSIVDVVLNTMHGASGEDGTVQKIFNDLKISHTGSGSKKIVDKYLMKKNIKDLGVRTPFGVTFSLPKESDSNFEEFVLSRAKHVFSRVSPPWVVKPTLGGSSIDTFIANDFPELFESIQKVLKNHDHVLVEEYVNGREITMGLIENFRGEENYFLIPTEIKKNNRIVDTVTRRDGLYKTFNPKDLSEDKRELMQKFMISAKDKFGLRHSFTADFIITPFGVYVLEIDALPAIDEHAILPKSLEAIGLTLPEYLDHIITEASKQA